MIFSKAKAKEWLAIYKGIPMSNPEFDKNKYDWVPSHIAKGSFSEGNEWVVWGRDNTSECYYQFCDLAALIPNPHYMFYSQLGVLK